MHRRNLLVQNTAFVSSCCFLLLLIPTAVTAQDSNSARDLQPIESIGAPSRLMIDVERFRFGTPDVTNRSFYPIPQDEITRASYLQAIDELNLEEIAATPNRGMSGPAAFMPVLAKYVATGEQPWADACIEMLKAFHQEMLRQVEERKWFWQFEHPAALIPLYRKYLMAGGAMDADATWFRKMWLCYCRNLHVWDTKPVEWRGGCHRSMPEGYAKGRAAEWYPDIPEAEHWANYSQWVFRDFWTTKDAPQNDTGYMMGPLIILICGGDQWTGDDRVYTHPEMQRLWQRLLVELSPDGIVNPYGPNGGWNSTADYRIAMLERLSTKTGDGRYRFGAHKLLNYLRYQSNSAESPLNRIRHAGSWLIALAYLFADDDVAPQMPNAGSQWTERVEAIRVPHTNKPLTERLLGNADPREDFGHICCSWYMTGKVWPDKMVLRSGWNPGDFFALVELHPTSFPANPGGIMGMNRWGAPFTQIVTSKGASIENRLLIEDTREQASRRFHPDKLRINEFWKSGEMPDIQSEVTYFKETPAATYASVRVRNMDGLPVIYEREFVFAKNRFLATREIVEFEESFPARVASTWNTHNIGSQIGKHWANTFIHKPVAANGTRSMKTPPIDLLVWFAPRNDRKLQIIDRLINDPRAIACPNQLRYLWNGTPEAGQKLVFTQVYFPHRPYRPKQSSNNPNPNLKVAYEDNLQATAHASGITVVRDDVEASVLRLELTPKHVEWVVFNQEETPIKLAKTETSERMHYEPAASKSPIKKD